MGPILLTPSRFALVDITMPYAYTAMYLLNPNPVAQPNITSVAKPFQWPVKTNWNGNQNNLTVKRHYFNTGVDLDINVYCGCRGNIAHVQSLSDITILLKGRINKESRNFKAIDTVSLHFRNPSRSRLVFRRLLSNSSAVIKLLM